MLSYGEARQKTTELARKLSDAGVDKGDTVILAIDHSVSSVLTLLALLEMEAICSPVAPDVNTHNLQRIADTFRPRFVIGSDQFLESPALAAGDRKNSMEGSCRSPGQPSLTVTVSEMVPIRIPKDAALVIFTSGSTGDPHGVIHGGFNLAFATARDPTALELSTVGFDRSFPSPVIRLRPLSGFPRSAFRRFDLLSRLFH